MASGVVPTQDPTISANVEVHMLRRHLDALPDFPSPAGFTLRQGPSPADWVAIQSAAESFLTVTLDGDQEGSWSHEFEPGRGNLPGDVPRDEALRNQFFLIDDSTGTAVATATAWRTRWHAQYAEMMDSTACDVAVGTDGLVHWVAIRPEYQGRGLSKPLLSAVLQCFPSMGCSTATLGTGTERAMAIPLYLKCGFEPMIFSPQERQAWQGLQTRAAAELQAEGSLDERAKAGHRMVAERLAGV